MKKFLLSIVVIAGMVSVSQAQSTTTSTSMKKQPTLGLNFILNDFTTAQRIKKNGLGGTLQNNDWARFNEMAYGLNLTYMEGLNNHIDFAGSLGASFLRYPFPDKAMPTSDALLLELDATVHVKLLTDKYILNPYINAGLGVGAYKMKYFNAYAPLGIGFQVNLGNNDAYFFAQGDYKTGVSGSAASHFTYSFGFAAPLKK